MLRVVAMLALTLSAASCLLLGEADQTPVELQDTASVRNLLLEIEALQLFRQLNLSREQLAQLRELAKETSQPNPARGAATKIDDRFRKTVVELHAALVADGDDEKIDELSTRLIELRNAEKEDLGDDYEMTEAARDQAPELLRSLAAGQVAAFIGTLANEVPEPLASIVEGLERARGMKDREWKAFREGLSDEVGRLLGGLDPEKAGECGDKVVQLLIVARSLSDDDFKQRRPALEKKARAIVGDMGPIQVLTHEVEYRLAELLSNPRLEGAIAARLK